MKAEIGPGHRGKTRAYFLMKVKKLCSFADSQSIFENKSLGDAATLHFQSYRAHDTFRVRSPCPLPQFHWCTAVSLERLGQLLSGQHGCTGCQTEADSKSKHLLMKKEIFTIDFRRGCLFSRNLETHIRGTSAVFLVHS